MLPRSVVALAAAAGILAVAACQDGLFAPRDARFQIQFDVRAVPSAVSSALELVELTTLQGSEQKNDSMTWEAVLEGTPFTVELKKAGEVRFDVVALAGTERPEGGVALLRGSTQAVVEDGFEVYVRLEDQTPVLVVSPEEAPCETDLNVVMRRHATIRLCNRGVGVLTWTGGGEHVVDADADTCPTPGRLCIALDPGSGEIPPGGDELVGLRAVGSGVAVDTIPVEFEEIFDGLVLDTITALVTVEVPSISIEVATVPTDTDEPPGPSIEVGMPLSVSYKVTNSSVIPLDHVVVTESDTLPTTEHADTIFELAGLEAGEVFDTTVIRPVLVGEQARKSTALGTLDAGDTARDSVVHYYVGLLPGVDLETLTNGLEDDTIPGPIVADGSDVEIEYWIRNIGEVPLGALTLTDSTGAVVPVTCAGGGGLPTTLAAADSVLCTLHLIATPGQFRQRYTVTGTTPAGQLMTDADPSHHMVPGPPPLLLELRVNGVRASAPPGPSIAVGLPVTWSYTVVNQGGPVTDLVVTDSVQGEVCVVSTLAAGATLRCPDKLGVSEVGQYASVATAVGETGDGTATASDRTYYLGYVPEEDPRIHVEMSTNGVDADSAPGPAIAVGGSVVWEYRVTNVGDVPLKGVKVYDDHLGLVCSHDAGSLDVGEGFTCYWQGIAAEGQYAALATARGTSPLGTEVEDTDRSHYVGVADGGSAGTVQR